jgi:hypothetical protein
MLIMLYLLAEFGQTALLPVLSYILLKSMEPIEIEMGRH